MRKAVNTRDVTVGAQLHITHLLIVTGFAIEDSKRRDPVDVTYELVEQTRCQQGPRLLLFIGEAL